MDQSPKHFQIDNGKQNINMADKAHFEIANHNSNYISNLNNLQHNYADNSINSPFSDQNKYLSSKNYYQFFGNKEFESCFSPLNPKTFFNNFNTYGIKQSNNHYYQSTGDSPFHNHLINGPSPMNFNLYKCINKTPVKYESPRDYYVDRRFDDHRELSSEFPGDKPTYSFFERRDNIKEVKVKKVTVEKLDLNNLHPKDSFKSQLLKVQKEFKDQIISIKQKIIPKNASSSREASNKSNKNLNVYENINNYDNESNTNSNNSNSIIKSNPINHTYTNPNNKSFSHSSQHQNIATYVMKSSNSLIYDFSKSVFDGMSSSVNGNKHMNSLNSNKNAFNAKNLSSINSTIFNENNINYHNLNHSNNFVKNNVKANLLEEEKSNGGLNNSMNGLNSNFNNSNNKIENTSNISQAKIFCKCKKSNCLKLYCACIANEQFCVDCNCVCCKNIPANEVSRNEALSQIKQKNPKAFKKKTNNNQKSKIVIEITKNDMEFSCKCSNSGCIQKYCECYKSNTRCSDKCGCKHCKNLKDTPYDTLNINHLHQESHIKVKAGGNVPDFKNSNINNINNISIKKTAIEITYPEYKNDKNEKYCMGQYGITRNSGGKKELDLQEYERKSFGVIYPKKLDFDNVTKLKGSNQGIHTGKNKIYQINNSTNNANTNTNNPTCSPGAVPSYCEGVPTEEVQNFTNSKIVRRALRGKKVINYQETTPDNTNLRLQSNPVNKLDLKGNIRHNNSSIKFLSNDSPTKEESDNEINDFNDNNLKKKRKRGVKKTIIGNEFKDKQIGQIGYLNHNFKTPITTPEINPRYSDKTDYTTPHTSTNQSKKIMVPKDFSNLKKNLDLNFKNI